MATADPERCPHCGANLIGEPIPEPDRHHYGGKSHFLRAIGIIEHDRLARWRCPDCGGEFGGGAGST